MILQIFLGSRSNMNLTTYSLEANLYATAATSGLTHDNDVIGLIAAATIDQDDTLHLIVAQSGGKVMMVKVGVTRTYNLYIGALYT